MSTNACETRCVPHEPHGGISWHCLVCLFRDHTIRRMVSGRTTRRTVPLEFKDSVSTHGHELKGAFRGAPPYSAGLLHEKRARRFCHTSERIFSANVSDTVVNIVVSSACGTGANCPKHPEQSVTPSNGQGMFAMIFAKCQPACITPACMAATRRSNLTQYSGSSARER